MKPKVRKKTPAHGKTKPHESKKAYKRKDKYGMFNDPRWTL